MYKIKAKHTRKIKGKLAELYKRLVEKEYIESGKEDTFIAIFSGFYLEHKDTLPIKWKCSISRMGDLDINNLTVLYYLITALRNWRHFCNWSENPKECFIQDILTPEDRELLTKYFIHENEEQINIKSLKIGSPINKRAIHIVKELIEPFYNEADKYL